MSQLWLNFLEKKRTKQNLSFYSTSNKPNFRSPWNPKDWVSLDFSEKKTFFFLMPWSILLHLPEKSAKAYINKQNNFWSCSSFTLFSCYGFFAPSPLHPHPCPPPQKIPHSFERNKPKEKPEQIPLNTLLRPYVVFFSSIITRTTKSLLSKICEVYI